MTATQPTIDEPRAREYETIYVLRPNVDPDEADRIANRVREVLEGMGAKLLRIDNWGRRKLAYTIRKATRGVFVYVRYVGLNNVVAEVERNLRLIDDVVRHQTIQIKNKVRVEDYAVDPAETQFRRLELPAPDEAEEPELAQRLGLVERPRHEGMDRGDAPEGYEGEEGMMDENIGGGGGGGGASGATEEES
jgi:small subunit ribosomal protein S6